MSSLIRNAVNNPDISLDEDTYKLTLVLLDELAAINNVVDAVKTGHKSRVESEKAKKLVKNKSKNTGKPVKDKKKGDEGPVISRSKNKF